MGSFYGNVTALDVTLDAVRAVAARPALVAQVGADVVVFAAVDDPMPTSGGALSAALGCTVVSTAVHDDDLLLVEVHRAGHAVLTGAVPDPAEVFGVEDPTLPPVLDDAQAEALVTAVGRGDVASVAAVLAAEALFASDAHAALAVALGLPACSVGWGHRYLVEDTGAFGGPPLEPLP